MRVAILGCGPSGMIAAHAARGLGHSVTIFSQDPRPSKMFGCQYLHSPIPNATELNKVAWVDYMLSGPIDGYRRKVYGDRAEVELSPETLSRHHPAWDIRTTYARLWERYGGRVEDVSVDAYNIGRVTEGFDTVVSTIPKPALCHKIGVHQFKFTSIFARGEAPEYNVFLSDIDCPRDMVICNGKDSPTWYRASNVFGHKTAEWAMGDTPESEGAMVRKPISNDCDCHSEVIRVGRYGAWRKGILASDAYSDTYAALRAVRV